MKLLHFPYAVAAIALIMGVMNCMGPRPYCHWQITSDPSVRKVGCAEVDVWSKRSTKTGLGVILHISVPQGSQCSVQLVTARLLLDQTLVPAPSTNRHLLLSPHDELFVYLPFVFDNNGAWNDGLNEAELSLELDVDHKRHTASWSLRQDFES
jgi:hypothetical protein